MEKEINDMETLTLWKKYKDFDDSLRFKIYKNIDTNTVHLNIDNTKQGQTLKRKKKTTTIVIV